MRLIRSLITGLFILAIALPALADEFDSGYRLGAGDRIRITVFGEPYLSGEFNVNANGSVSLPLIEPVAVAGLTLDEEIARGLSEGEPKTVLAKRLARSFSLGRAEVYDRVVELSSTE